MSDPNLSEIARDAEAHATPPPFGALVGRAHQRRTRQRALATGALAAVLAVGVGGFALSQQGDRSSAPAPLDHSKKTDIDGFATAQTRDVASAAPDQALAVEYGGTSDDPELDYRWVLFHEAGETIASGSGEWSGNYYPVQTSSAGYLLSGVKETFVFTDGRVVDRFKTLTAPPGAPSPGSVLNGYADVESSVSLYDPVRKATWVAPTPGLVQGNPRLTNGGRLEVVILRQDRSVAVSSDDGGKTWQDMPNEVDGQNEIVSADLTYQGQAATRDIDDVERPDKTGLWTKLTGLTLADGTKIPAPAGLPFDGFSSLVRTSDGQIVAWLDDTEGNTRQLWVSDDSWSTWHTVKNFGTRTPTFSQGQLTAFDAKGFVHRLVDGRWVELG